MVGLSGYFDCSSAGTTTSDILTEMSDQLVYTGNEKTDFWEGDALGVSRVHHAVTNTESQPIRSEDGRYIIMMSGELYGQSELRDNLKQQGYVFNYGDNDAELCLQLYLESGTSAFDSLNGTFCCVIHDTVESESVIVNDRFSSVPIYYHVTDNGVVFSTSVHAITEHPDVAKELNLDAVVNFFTFQRTFGTETYYRDIQMVEPGSILTISSSGEVQTKEYWRWEYKFVDKPISEHAEELAEAIIDAVARRATDDLRYGLFLSGGLDSRAILAGVVRNGLSEKFTVYSFGGDRYVEEDAETARNLTGAVGVDHTVIENESDILDESILEEVVRIGDGMHRVDHAPMREYIYNTEGIDVAFHGLELDYTLGGNFLPSKRISLLGRSIPLPTIKSGKVENIHDELYDRIERLSFADPEAYTLLNDVSAEQHQQHLEQLISDVVDDPKRFNNDANAALEYFLFNPAYKNHVHLNDSSVGAHIPTRPIVYDSDLLEKYLEIPPKLRNNANVYRRAIKNINSDLAKVEYANTGHRADLSPVMEYIYQAKDKLISEFTDSANSSEPSYTQLGIRIRETPRIRDKIGEIVEDPECISPEIFNVDLIRQKFDLHMEGKQDNHDLLLKVLTFGMWYRDYGPSTGH